jgi:hypothetical protein
MLAIREGGNLSNAGVGNMEGGQELNDTTLFGEHIYLYDILINQSIQKKGLSIHLGSPFLFLFVGF